MDHTQFAVHFLIRTFEPFVVPYRCADLKPTSKAVRDLLREHHRLSETAPDDFIVRDLAAAQRAQSRSAFLMMLAGAAAVSLLVGGSKS